MFANPSQSCRKMSQNLSQKKIKIKKWSTTVVSKATIESINSVPFITKLNQYVDTNDQYVAHLIILHYDHNYIKYDDIGQSINLSLRVCIINLLSSNISTPSFFF